MRSPEARRRWPGGRLPVDDAGHRVGEPDLLVRHGEGYVPVDVKWHKSLRAAREPGAGTALVSGLDEPFPTTAVADPDADPRKHHGDLLQLAHYRRLLESAGLASPSANLGGICGSEGMIVWYDLDERSLGPPEYLEAAPAGPLSAMERYDLDFAYRLEVHLAALAHIESEGSPLLAEPVVCADCAMCRWRDWCGERLAEAADLSLISGVDVVRRRLYKTHGVDDLHALAALDWTTAELVRADVDLAGLLAKAEHLPGGTPLAGVIPTRTKQLEHLAAAGITTVGDTAAIDRRTLGLCVAGATNLTTQIDLARRPGGRGARLPAPRREPGRRPPRRRRGGRGHGEHQRRLLSLGRARHRPACRRAGGPVTPRPRRGTPTSRTASWARSPSSGRGSPGSGRGRTPRAPRSAPTATAGARRRRR